MKLKFTCLTLILAFVVQLSFAQDRTITGKVADESNLPLPGVNILVKGTSRGAQTDFDGAYSIKASSGEVLVFSYIGLKTQEIVIGSSNTIDLVMEEDISSLQEVVITGYGTSTKQAFAGTATTVKSENLVAKNVSNVSQALAGEVAGVTVINTSGQPGTTSTIRIRGFGSVNGNRSPLYVLDGVPFSGSLNSINPSDIQSMTVLKDATATAIYGARGSNGVILITTKSGKAGESYIEAEVKTGMNVQIVPRYDVIKSPEEYIGYAWEGKYNRGVITGESDPVAYANANLFSASYVDPGYNMWNVAGASELIDPVTHMVRNGVTRIYTPELYSDAAFDSAFRKETNVRMGGGSEKSDYYFSVGYLDDDGYAIKTNFKRYNTRLNLNSDLREWLKVGANIGYTFSESLNNGQTAGSENVFEFADKMAPIFPVYLRDNNYNLVPDQIFGGYQYDYGSVSGFRSRPNANNLNPIASALYDFNGSKRHELNGNVSVNIKFTDYLTLENRYGYQYSMERFKSYTNPFYGTATGDGGNLATTDRERLSQDFLSLLRFKDNFGEHSIEALIAHQSNEYTFSESAQFKGLVVLDGLLELDNFVNNLAPPSGFSEGFSIESFFAQINYDFRDTYYFTISGRRDGSSRFVKDKWDNFGSVGVAWVASNEDFLKNDVLSFLKLKASYGITGDQAGVGYYSGYDTYNTSFLGGISISPRGNGSPDLTWETAKMYQVGLEFTLGDYIDGNIDYYNKRTDNLIFDRRVGPSQGIAIITVNDGELENQGFEFDITGHLIDTNDFKLDLTVNGEIFDNKIITMPIDPATGEQKYLDNQSGNYGWSVGRSIFDFYMREWAGVDPADGSPMWYQYYDDMNNNGILDDGEGDFEILEDGINTNQTGSIVEYTSRVSNTNIKKTVTHTYADATQVYNNKSAIPDVRGAFRLTGVFKNFNFATQFTYSLGGWAYDGQYGELMSDRFGGVGNNYHRDIAERWMQPGDITNVPRLSDGIDQTASSPSTRFLTKTDYLALNNALIGYTMPRDFLAGTGIDDVNIWVSGDNLFIKTARDGFNPTTSESGNSGRRLYAPMTTFTLGARVKF